MKVYEITIGLYITHTLDKNLVYGLVHGFIELCLQSEDFIMSVKSVSVDEATYKEILSFDEERRAIVNNCLAEKTPDNPNQGQLF